MDLHSDHPYWLLKNGLLSTYPPVESDLSADVLIIGGGISGAMLAARLVEEGVDVVLTDRREFGTGSTCASTALLLYELDEPLVSLIKKRGRATAEAAYRASYETLQQMPEWAERGGGAGPVSFGPKPSLYLASSKRDAAWLKEECAERQALDFDCEMMEAADLDRDFGFDAPLALRSPNAAEVDAYRLTHGLHHYSSGRGARLYDRTAITKIREDKTGITATTDEGHTISARKVVFAAGYESQAYLRRSVAKNVSTFAFVSEPVTDLGRWRDHAHIWETAHPYVYIRTTPDQRIIMGGEDEKFVNPIRRDAHLPSKVRKLEKRFLELFPHVPLRVAFSWAGTFAETPDSMPRIGQTKDWQHGYFALGYGGNGITFSALAAEILTVGLTGRHHPWAEVFAFE